MWIEHTQRTDQAIETVLYTVAKTSAGGLLFPLFSRPDEKGIPISSDRGDFDCESICLRIRDGDRSAETELYHQYHRKLSGILWIKFHNQTLCEDVTQETFQIVLERLRTRGIDEPRSLTGFICKVAIYQGSNYINKEKKNSSAIDPDTIDRIEGDEEAPEQDYRNQELVNFVKTILDEMKTPRDREILIRYYYRNEPGKEISRDLDISHEQFHRVISRARQRMKGLIESKPGFQLPWAVGILIGLMTGIASRLLNTPVHEGLLS